MACRSCELRQARSRSRVRASTCASSDSLSAASASRARALILDVGVGADPAHQGAFRAAQRQRPRDVPAVLPVGAAQAELGLVRLFGGQRLGPGGGGIGEIVGVHQHRPALSVQLPDGGAAVGVDLFVEPVEHAVRAGRPHVVGQGLGDGTELQLREGVVGDVATHADEALRPAVGAGQRRDDDIPPSRLARVRGTVALEPADAARTRIGHGGTRRVVVGALPHAQP